MNQKLTKLKWEIARDVNIAPNNGKHSHIKDKQGNIRHE